MEQARLRGFAHNATYTITGSKRHSTCFELSGLDMLEGPESRRLSSAFLAQISLFCLNIGPKAAMNENDIKLSSCHLICTKLCNDI